MKTKNIKEDEVNIAQKNNKVNPETLLRALKAIKARGNTNDLHAMREISEEYAIGMQFSLGMGWDSFVTRFTDPRYLTLEDILNISDITGLEETIILKIAVDEAKKNHIKRDISNLLPNAETETE